MEVELIFSECYASGNEFIMKTSVVTLNSHSEPNLLGVSILEEHLHTMSKAFQLDRTDLHFELVCF